MGVDGVGGGGNLTGVLCVLPDPQAQLHLSLPTTGFYNTTLLIVRDNQLPVWNVHCVPGFVLSASHTQPHSVFTQTLAVLLTTVS